jgi:hypothetical protein
MKLLSLSILALGLMTGALYAQSFTVTNKFTMSSTIDVVHTINLGSMVPVVSSAGTPMTNSSLWGPWIPKYIDACIYTNGLTTNNVTDVRVLWTRPVTQLRYIYQGNPDVWDGKSYIRLPLAKERILAGERLHVLLSVNDQTTITTNLASSTNVIYSSAGVMYKLIEIPPVKPSWIP